MFLRNLRHSSLVLWANADVTTLEECGSMSELCIVMFSREKCASARVQVGVVSTPPSRSWQLLLSGRDAARFSNFCRRTNGTKLNMQSELTGWHWQRGISRLRMLFPAAIRVWVRCCRISPLVWPFVVLPFLRVPFLPTLSPWRRTPPCWAWWPVWRMMVVGNNRWRSPRCHSPASLIHWPTVLLNERRWRLWLSSVMPMCGVPLALLPPPLDRPFLLLDQLLDWTAHVIARLGSECWQMLLASGHSRPHRFYSPQSGYSEVSGASPTCLRFPFIMYDHLRRGNIARSVPATRLLQHKKNVNSTPSAHTFSHADRSLRLLSEFLVQL